MTCCSSILMIYPILHRLKLSFICGDANGVLQHHFLTDTPADSLVFASETIFPNIHCLFRLICTLPVTSCECEHSISVLRRLKTYLRSSMGQERLSGLALMHIHYGMELDLDEIINIFARKHPRRMVLSDILCDQ